MKNPLQKSVQESLYVALLLLAAGASAASAQSGPSPQEQMACRSDAGKLCAEHIGKPPQMNACLREHKAKLSDSAARWWKPAAGRARGFVQRKFPLHAASLLW